MRMLKRTRFSSGMDRRCYDFSVFRPCIHPRASAHWRHRRASRYVSSSQSHAKHNDTFARLHELV
jgi:hypothetical protein